MGESLFRAWVLRILKECVRDRGHLTLSKARTKHPTICFCQAGSQGLTQRITVGFQTATDTMASRLPRSFTATHGMIAGGRGTGIARLLQRRTFSASPPPAAVGENGGQPGKPEVSKHVRFSYSVYGFLLSRRMSPVQISFYKEFGRPMSKVFLMAFFSYQVFYWLWVKMEKDEEKKEKDSGYFQFSVG